ncbi:MAG: 8-oxo-dGTP diphosphatase [Candidatus Ozemobacteraceae bacterium]
MKLATLCYLRHECRTLMLFRNKKIDDVHEGKWNGLGGKFEPGETPEACAIREVHEESGLTVEAVQLKGILTFPMFAKGEDWYVFAFVISRFSGEMKPSNEGTLKWIPDERLLELPMWDGDRIFLPWLDHPGVFSGRFSYKDGKLVSHEVAFYT